MRHIDAGLHIIREGEVGDSLFILVEGEARAFHEGPPEVPLTDLGEGSFFGEVALLSNRQRSASVRAVTDCTLMVVSREVVHELIGEHYDALPVLLRFFRERIVRSVVESNPLFSRFDSEERLRLVQRFAFFEAKSGTTLLREGETGDGLFILLCGDVEVSRGREPLGTCRTGSVFGEESLMKGEPSAVTVRAGTKCWLLKMTRDTFREVIMTHGAILEVLGEEIEANRKRWESPVGVGKNEEAGPLII